MLVLENRRAFSEILLSPLVISARAFFFLAVLALFLAFFLLRSRDSEPDSAFQPFRFTVNEYEAIGQGILSLRREKLPRFPRVNDELTLFAQNSRPDAETLEKELDQPRLLMGVRGNATPLPLLSGQPLFLSWERPKVSKGEWNGPPAPLIVSSSPSSLRIEPLILNNTAFVQVTNGEEKVEFVVKKGGDRPLSLSEISRGSNWYKLLKGARVWNIDQFLSVYGKMPAGVFRIGFGKECVEKVIIAAPRDYLFFGSGAWQVGNLEQAKGHPVAQILELKEGSLALAVWDETGFFHETVVVPQLMEPSAQFTNVDTIFTSLKARNSSEVSCMMGKRRVVLKPGDWWIRTDGGWRRLKKKSEIDDYLHFRLLGEIIVVDGLESYQGKTVIKGHQFDQLHQHLQAFQIPMTEALGKTPGPFPGPSPASHQTPGEKTSKPQPIPRKHKKGLS